MRSAAEDGRKSCKRQASRSLRSLIVAGSLGIAGALGAQVQPSLAAAPHSPARPFYVGERLEYAVRLSGVGMKGRGAMWIDGPELVRGIETWVLHFGFKARVGPVRVSDATQSWLDPRRMASLRFTKRERHPLSSEDEDVTLYPDERRWSAADGEAGESFSDAPLDELSFIYFLRTVPLAEGAVYTFDRHFDAARNPTVVRAVKRERLTTGAGTFATVLIEMRVKDPARYQGQGVIRIHFSDDERRLPVRIESNIPQAGRVVMTLESLPAIAPPLLSVRPGA
jgi:Protein of unknown function (DUF3108)